MPKPLSQQQIAQLWVKAGGSPKLASLMARIGERESGGQYWTDNSHNGPGGGPLNHNGTVDYGLFAINSVHGYNPQKLKSDPLYNAKAAVAIYKQQGLKAWSTYNPATDAQYIGQAAQRQSAAKLPASLRAAPAPAAASDARRQIALSLIGFGGLGSSYGGDSLTSALLSAARTQQAARPARVKRPTATSPSASAHGVTTFDGKPVASWIAPILKQARATGLWKGSVTSGERTKSQQLAAAKGFGLQNYGPKGPLASNHVYGNGGAVDVSDPAGLKRALARLGVTSLRSAMANDPVHFSKTGY